MSKTIKELERRIGNLECDVRSNNEYIIDNRTNFRNLERELADKKEKLIWNIFKVFIVLCLTGLSFCLGRGV